MPFDRPDIQELQERAEAHLETGVTGARPRLRRSLLNALARMHTGALHGLYAYLEFLSKQMFVHSAEGEYLEGHAQTWLEDGRKAASKAGGEVEWTGNDGATIPEGTELQRDNGVAYVVDAAASISGGTATTAITAVEAGTDGNADAGTELSLVAPIAGIDSTATVIGTGLTGGADQEGDEALRDRAQQRIHNPPQGGAASDYVRWAREVEGVTRAWPYSNSPGLGQVTVRFMMDNTYEDGIPQSGDVQTVQDYLDHPDRKPLGADVFAVAPNKALVDVTVQIDPNTEAMRGAIDEEIADLFRRTEPGETILISQLRQAIGVTGVNDYALVTPTTDVTHDVTEIPVLGTTSYQSL